MRPSKLRGFTFAETSLRATNLNHSAIREVFYSCGKLDGGLSGHWCRYEMTAGPRSTEQYEHL